MSIGKKVQEILGQINAGTITAVNLRPAYLNEDEFEAIAKSLITNTSVTTLELNVNYIDQKGVRAMVAFLNRNSTVNILRLEVNMIEGEGKCEIDTALQTRRFNTLSIHSKSYKRLEGLGAMGRFISRNEPEIMLACVAACALALVCYKKPEILTNLNHMFSSIFEKASSFVVGK